MSRNVSPAPAPPKILLIAVGDARDYRMLEAAAEVVKSNGANLVLAAVLSRLPPAFQRLSLVIEAAELWGMAVRERLRYLETLATERSSDTKVGLRILFGQTVDAIVRETSLRQYDVVMVPRSRWTKHVPDWLRFDLPTRLARRCPCLVRTSYCHGRTQATQALRVGSLTAH